MILGFPVLGAIAQLNEFDHDAVIVVIGDNVILNTGCTVDHHNHIGDHAHIAPGVHLGGDVTIGEGTLIGIGAIVIPQCAVGAWSVIGAGSVVTRDIPAHATAVGMPARVIRREQGS